MTSIRGRSLAVGDRLAVSLATAKRLPSAKDSLLTPDARTSKAFSDGTMLLSIHSYGISTTPRSNNSSLMYPSRADAGSEAIPHCSGVVLIPYESILRSSCLSEKALEIRTSVVRSEYFALGKRFAVATLTASLSPRAELRPRLHVTSGRLFRHPLKT